MDAKKTGSAHGQKVLTVTVKPSFVGAHQATNIESLIYKSYKKALQEIPASNKYRIYADIKFKSNQGGKYFHVTSKNVNKKDAVAMFSHLVDRINNYVTK